MTAFECFALALLLELVAQGDEAPDRKLAMVASRVLSVLFFALALVTVVQGMG